MSQQIQRAEEEAQDFKQQIDILQSAEEVLQDHFSAMEAEAEKKSEELSSVNAAFLDIQRQAAERAKLLERNDESLKQALGQAEAASQH